MTEAALSKPWKPPTLLSEYAPFDGDGRRKVGRLLWLPNTTRHAVTNSVARGMIDRFMATGHSTHSGTGATLWVLLVWCQSHEVPYTLRAEPGFGYYIERISKE